ncbi:hypothetical protein PACTADRAFT_36315 [Pachysolen tannophilus NRRL Y-2460]|uniref:Uncharacterized protein n=1 Tax=Pachysolen tannophilus NRRL Y-2460 TaxID=669874 RepID=A0A1E4U1S4_PACTA|nr:hypothetical protein PACTADRAFT_36315 [Pachysolen tannophilus NRRL Y-2460]
MSIKEGNINPKSLKLSLKKPRITDSKIIKHAPVRQFKYSNLQKKYYIKSSTPFISSLKHIDKKLVKLESITNKQKSKQTYISIFGMGKTIEKVLNIGLHYQDEKHYRIETLTGSTVVLDEFENLKDFENENILRKRELSGIEIRIYFK